MSEPGFNPLRGEGLATEGAVLQESLRLQRLWHLDEVHPGGSSFDTWRASGMAASSLVFGEDASSQGHGNRSNVNIEARVLNGVLTLWATRVLGSKTVADVNYRMTLVDGRPLPARRDRTAKDQVSGRRPANVESIDIRVIAVMPDGREVLQDVRVNLKTGDIEPIARRDASLAPRMFSSQFRAMEPIGASGREALARVLAK